MTPFKDLTDRRFGKLTTVESHQKWGWHCRCDCGTSILAATKLLLRGSITSCGCRRKEFGKRTFIDMTGKTYGRIKVSERVKTENNIHTMWLCECDCGNQFISDGYQIRTGKSTHCGCRRGQRHIRALSGFRNLLSCYRCASKTRKLPFTLNDAAFLLLTQSPCYYCGITPYRTRTSSEDHSPYPFNGIDRIDSNCGYELWNCVSCCAECNLAKRDKTANEFQAWLDRLSEYHSNQFQPINAVAEIMCQCA